MQNFVSYSKWYRVTEGFAGVKLSGSLRMFGSFRVRMVKAIIAIVNPTMSFTVKRRIFQFPA